MGRTARGCQDIHVLYLPVANTLNDISQSRDAAFAAQLTLIWQALHEQSLSLQWLF